MENLINGLMGLHPHLATAILAAVSYLIISGFKIKKNLIFAISILVPAVLAYLLNGRIDLLGTELISALAGVAIAPRLYRLLKADKKEEDSDGK